MRCGTTTSCPRHAVLTRHAEGFLWPPKERGGKGGKGKQGERGGEGTNLKLGRSKTNDGGFTLPRKPTKEINDQKGLRLQKD